MRTARSRRGAGGGGAGRRRADGSVARSPHQVPPPRPSHHAPLSRPPRHSRDVAPSLAPQPAWQGRAAIRRDARVAYPQGGMRAACVRRPGRAARAGGAYARVASPARAPAGATSSIISRGPPYAPTGRPPPMTLPICARARAAALRPRAHATCHAQRRARPPPHAAPRSVLASPERNARNAQAGPKMMIGSTVPCCRACSRPAPAQAAPPERRALPGGGAALRCALGDQRGAGAHGGEVGRDAKVRLRAALGDAEAGHDLVEAQQRAVLRAHVAQALRAAPAARRRRCLASWAASGVGGCVERLALPHARRRGPRGAGAEEDEHAASTRASRARDMTRGARAPGHALARARRARAPAGTPAWAR